MDYKKILGKKIFNEIKKIVEKEIKNSKKRCQTKTTLKA